MAADCKSALLSEFPGSSPGTRILIKVNYEQNNYSRNGFNQKRFEGN